MKRMISTLSLGLVALLVSFTQIAQAGEGLKVNASSSTVKWKGTKVTGEHSGMVKVKSGNIEMNDGKLSGGSFEMDMNSITCDDIEDESYNHKLVGHLKSEDFFGVSKFPTSKMVITSVKSLGGNKYQVTGNFTIKGITKTIEFPAEITKDGSKVNAMANITINRTEFNIKYGSGSFFDDLGDKVIHDDFTLTVKLVAG